MNDATHQLVAGQIESTPAEEAARLQTALDDADRMLTESLREDERRRRRRRLVSLTLLVGGIAMSTTVVAVLAGWLTLAVPPPVEPATADAATSPLDESARIERAEELAQQGWREWRARQFREAAVKFEEASQLDPHSASIWNGLGWARFNGGDANGGIVAFEQCVALEPEHPAGLNGLGQAYLSLREYDTAEKFLRKAAPQAPAAEFGLARLYLLQGEFKQAQTWIRKALRQQPGDATLKAALAAARAGKLPDELRKQLEPPEPVEATSAAEASVEGWRQFNEGKLRSAELSFRRALAKDPEDGAALNGLGFCLLNNGKAASAKPYFEKCLKLEPGAAGAMNGLARCLKAEGKVDEALALWKRMEKDFAGPNAATVGLATTYLEREEYGKALPLYEKLVQANPKNEAFAQGLAAAKEGVKGAEAEVTK